MEKLTVNGLMVKVNQDMVKAMKYLWGYRGYMVHFLSIDSSVVQ